MTPEKIDYSAAKTIVVPVKETTMTDFDTGKYFLENIEDHNSVTATLSALQVQLAEAVLHVCESLSKGGKVMFCGNGGSAADCQHLAAEFTGRFTKDRKPLAGLALTTDTSAMTCIPNDYAFEDVFSRQVLALGRAGDCLIGISTSGHSANVIKAVEVARQQGIRTIGLLGRDGGELARLCDISLVVQSKVTARIQEAHILIGHTLCGAVERQLGLVHHLEG